MSIGDNYGKEHSKVAKRALRYLNGTFDYELVYTAVISNVGWREFFTSDLNLE